MEKVVCVVDNHIHLEYGKTYEITGEAITSIRVRGAKNVSFGLGKDGWWNKKLFVSLEEFRKKQIEKILD